MESPEVDLIDDDDDDDVDDDDGEEEEWEGGAGGKGPLASQLRLFRRHGHLKSDGFLKNIALVDLQFLTVSRGRECQNT